jgi:hypothetical protein
MRAYAGVAVVVLFLVTPSDSVLAAQEALPKITALDGDPLSVEAKRGKDTASTHISVLNASDRAADITVALQAASSDKVSVVGFKPTSAEPGATRVTVTLNGLEALEADPVEGHLVVTGGAAPVARAVSIKPVLRPSRDWPEWIFWRALVVFGVLMVIGVIAGYVKSSLFAPAPGPKWSFDSWATTLTAAGGILGTVLGAATFPPVPSEIDKETLIRLNLFFGVLVVVGPFIFQATRNPLVRATDQDAGFSGFNVTLLIACSITGAAVFGQLVALGLLGWELTGGNDWGEAIKLGIIVLCVLGALYFISTVLDLVTTDWKAEARNALDATKKQSFGIVLTRITAQGADQKMFRVQLTREELLQAAPIAAEQAAAPGDAPQEPLQEPEPERSVPMQPAPSWNLP